jgi:Mg2+/Co2+ transporter CorB
MIILSVIIIAILIAISALFAATETAITATSPGKIQRLKSEGNTRAGIVLSILKAKENVISTMLIGNSLINTICTTIATGMFIELLGDNVGTIVSSVVMAFLIIVFAEVVPKAIAVIKAEPIIMLTAPTIVLFLKILQPVNSILAIAVKVFCRVFGIELKHSVSGAEEVRGVIEHHHQEGNVYKTYRDMLGGVLDLNDIHVSEIMVHRRDVESINVDLPTDEIVKKMLSSSYSRIPFWEENKDNIIGVLHIKDLTRVLYANSHNIEKVNIRELLVQPWFISEDILVGKQLNAFRTRNSHFACVIDEFGAWQGILTLEDILEEIVGQIKDEYDYQVEPIIHKSATEVVINGSTTIRDINRELGWGLPDDAANTIAGLIMHEIKRIPNQGEKIEIFNLKISIIKKIGNKIETVKVNMVK